MSPRTLTRNARLLLGVFFIVAALAASSDAQSRTFTQPHSPSSRIHPLVWQAAALLQSPNTAVQEALAPDAILLSDDGEIGVEITPDGSPSAAAEDLATLGVRVSDWSVSVPLVGAWVRPDQLAALASRAPVAYVRPMMPPVVRTGSMTSEGDSILYADQARDHFGLTGRGIRIGVISDGVDTLAVSQAAGDLPPLCSTLPTEPMSVCVYVDPDRPGWNNEGVAMLEIIHDLAPEAILGFSSGFSGVSGFVGAVDFLQYDFQADVIVDDLGYLNEPFFENGIIGTRAQRAVDEGVVFVSAAGNDADIHYQARFDPLGDCVEGVSGDCSHRFESDGTTMDDGDGRTARPMAVRVFAMGQSILQHAGGVAR